MGNCEKKLKKIIKDNNFITFFRSESETESLGVEVSYRCATDFSVLEPELKKQAKLVREALFSINTLYKIAQGNFNDDSTLKFYFYKDLESEEITFTMPDIDSGKIITWDVSKNNIEPEKSLVPWYYKNEHIALRAKMKSPIPLSEYICFMSSSDFGIDALRNALSKTCEILFTFKDLIEISKNSKDMDFSDYIRESKTKHYKSWYKKIKKYYKNAKTPEGKIANIGLVKSNNDDSPEKIQNDREKFLKLLESNDRSSALEELQENEKLPNNIEELVPQKILNDKEKLLEALEKAFPFSEKQFCESELANRISKPTPTTKSIEIPVTLSSIDKRFNLLNLLPDSRDYPPSCKVRSKDIIVSEADYSFGDIAIVDESNEGRLLTDQVTHLGCCKQDEVYVWKLCCSDYIRQQIAALNDPSLKKICYRSAFNNIYVDSKDINNRPLNSLYFELARLIVGRTFEGHVSSCFYFGQKFDVLIKSNISSLSLEYFILTHKTKALIRSAKPNNNKGLIVHNNKTQVLAKKIKPIPQCIFCNIDDNPSQKDILQQLIKTDICLVFLSFDSIEELQLAQKIIKIMGENHIIIEEGEKNTVVGKAIVPDKLISYLGNINYCTLTEYQGGEIKQSMVRILYRHEYREDIFRNFVFNMAHLSTDCFKKIPCQGDSTARRKLSSKELDIFYYIQKGLIHLGYNFNTGNLSLGMELLILIALEDRLNGKLMPSLDPVRTWEKFKNENSNFVRHQSLNSFITGYRSLIKAHSQSLPILYKHLNTMKKTKKIKK